MEGQDVFAQEIASGEDPFAGSDFDDSLPVVDREGNAVAHQPTDGASVESQEGTRPDEQVAPEAAQEAGQPVPADPTPPPVSDGPIEAPATHMQGGVDQPDRSGGHPTLTPEQAEAKAQEYRESHGEPDPTPAEADGATGSTTEPDPTPASSSPQPPVTGEGDGEDEFAEPPAETTSKKGTTTKRRYLIFRVDGPGKLTQVDWYEDAKGNLTQRGHGAKRQRVVLARGTEEALKFGYAAVGSPANGAHLVAVAQLHFQPRKVRPKPPEPLRQRLEIS